MPIKSLSIVLKIVWMLNEQKQPFGGGIVLLTILSMKVKMSKRQLLCGGW